MNHHYKDILSRIPDPPRWFDENATPRWDDFNPYSVADIYADQVALMLISCQSCDTMFDVAFSARDNQYDWEPEAGWKDAEFDVQRGETRADDIVSCRMVFRPQPSLADLAASGRLHYGDPPNVGCCAAGPTENSVPREILEFWQRNRDPATVAAQAWVRRHDLEGPVPPRHFDV